MIRQLPVFIVAFFLLCAGMGFRPVSDDTCFLQLKDTFQSGKVSYTIALRLSYLKVASGRDVVMPVFAGGTDSLELLLAEKLKVGKCFNGKDSLEGQFYFSVDTLGNTGSVSVFKSLDPNLDLQLMQLIEGLVFTPAYYGSSKRRTARVGRLDVKMRYVGRKKR